MLYSLSCLKVLMVPINNKDNLVESSKIVAFRMVILNS